MQDILSQISALNRPRLLVRAARFAVDDYHRATLLPRLLLGEVPDRSGPAILRLMEIEAEMNEHRERRAADYSIADHVSVLIALMGEARLLRASGLNVVPIT